MQPKGLVLILHLHQAPERIFLAVTEHRPKDAHLQFVCLSSSTGETPVLKQNHPGTRSKISHNRMKAFVNVIS